MLRKNVASSLCSCLHPALAGVATAPNHSLSRLRAGFGQLLLEFAMLFKRFSDCAGSMMLALVLNVLANPRQLPLAERDDAVPSLPFDHLPFKMFIRLTRRRTLQFADEISRRHKGLATDRKMQVRVGSSEL